MSAASLRRASLLAPALVLTLSGFAQAQTFAVEVTADVLNVRAAAMGTVLGQVHRGDRFAANAQQNGWLRIDWQGRAAWISGTYARRITADMVQTTVNVNVRAGANTSHQVLGVATRGQTYVKVGGASGWHQIQFDARRGYCVDWATTSRSASTASSPPATTSAPATSSTTAAATPTSSRRYNATAAEVEIMARIIKGEALQCSFEGKVAVGAVILNRVRDRRWPNTIAGVAHQPYQFSCYNANVRSRLYWGPVPQVCFDAARAALAGQDPSLGATHYFNPYLVRPSWARTLRFIKRIGTNRTNTHDFYR
ncbi:MAG: cell wall hydrolase [Planctomycetes bacterium]|nr:cell wall hydrolase [Planctomycetota bacterium]